MGTERVNHMLSRNAQGLYWMSRYLERVHHLSRVLQLQTEALVDRPIREIHFGWIRIYRSVNRIPPAGDIELINDDDFTLADSYTLTDDLTFESSNPDSLLSCFAMARENARQMRQCISAEMWTTLNLSHLRMRNLRIEDIWASSPETFYAQTSTEINTFIGVSGISMYRDQGWRFMQLGRFIERAQLLASLLLNQLQISQTIGDDNDADWTSLLRIYHAFDAYDSKYSVEVHPDQVLNLLATDPLLPNSLSNALGNVEDELALLPQGPDTQARDSAQHLARSLNSLINDEWADTEDKYALLLSINQQCRELHYLVSNTYFEYSLDQS